MGAGLGLALGAVDASKGKTGIGALILRDMKPGANFGGLIGLITGGIKAVNNNDSRALGDGTAWGYLGGAVVGAGIALFVEAPRSPSITSMSHNFNSSLVYMQDSRNNTYPALAARYSF